MAHLLHIDVSPRQDRSISRTLTQEFITDWKTAHPSDTVTYRDLGHHALPFVDEDKHSFRDRSSRRSLSRPI